MKINIIRNATQRITYAGHLFIADPYLAEKFSRPSYTGKSPNPLVDLPISAAEVIAGIEMALISHLHSDHFDPAAHALLLKNTPILCQPDDQPHLQKLGFSNVTPIQSEITWQGITITRIDGQHGSGTVLKEMGKVSGFVFQAPGEPCVYWVGDSIFTPTVEATITHFKPDIILTHSCGAKWGQGTLIVMDAAQTVAVCKLAPKSIVVAIHMEALDHATITRKALREYAEQAGITSDQLYIPKDGETLTFVFNSQSQRAVFAPNSTPA